MGPNLITDLLEDVKINTTQICSECGELLTFTEEIYLLQIMQPHLQEGRGALNPVLDDEDDDFVYEPHFLHFECWESVVEELRKTVEDKPPVADAQSPFACPVCESGIREWELVGVATIGELHVSKRAPTGQHGEDFQTIGPPDVFCLPCLHNINLEITEFWNEQLSQEGECELCLFGRCWRDDTCSCTCHEQ